MKLEKFKEESLILSGKASDIIRQLGFAGIAIIWIFKVDNPKDHLLPTELIRPLRMLIATLGLDLLQYFIPSLIWSAFYMWHENKGPDRDMKANYIHTAPAWIFYFGKMITLAIAYVQIFKFLLAKI